MKTGTSVDIGSSENIARVALNVSDTLVVILTDCCELLGWVEMQIVVVLWTRSDTVQSKEPLSDKKNKNNNDEDDNYDDNDDGDDDDDDNSSAVQWLGVAVEAGVELSTVEISWKPAGPATPQLHCNAIIIMMMIIIIMMMVMMMMSTSAGN